LRKNPERFLSEIGIAEANMMGIAAGLNHWRKNSLYRNFLPNFFQPERVYDQIDSLLATLIKT